MRVVRLVNKQAVQSLMFSVDGRTLAVSQPGIISILDPLGLSADVRHFTGDAFGGGDKPAHTVRAATADGRFITVWATSTYRIDPHRNTTEEITYAPRARGSITVAPGGRYAVEGVTIYTKCLRHWRIGESTAASHQWDAPDLPGTYLQDVQYFPDCERIAVAGWGRVGESNVGQLAVYARSTGTRTAICPTPFYFAYRVLVTPDNSHILVSSYSSFCVFDADQITAKPVTVEHPVPMVHDTWAVHPSGERVVNAGTDGVLRVWDTVTWREVKAYQWKVGKLTAVVFSPDGTVCAAAGSHGRLVVWDWDG